MKRILPFLVLMVVLVLAAGLVYQFAAPQIVSMEPSSGSVKVHPGAELRITFSRQMNPQSVQSHFKLSPTEDGEFTWEDKTLIFKPRGGWQNGNNVQVELAAGSTAGGLLPLAVRQDFQGSFQVSNPRIAYLYPATGLASLYAIQPISGEIELLTDFQSGILDFDASSRQNLIYFSGRNSAGGSDIFEINLAPDLESSEEPTEILSCKRTDCRAVVVSPKGDYLAFEKTVPISSDGTGFPQIWLLPITPDGEPTGDPFPIGDSTHQTLLPSWSPTGLLAYYDNTDATYIFYDPQKRSEIIRLPNESGETGSWSLDGSVFVVPELYFLDDELPGSGGKVGPVVNSRLVAFHIHDGMLIDLTKADDVEDMLPSFSPDGENLAFARRFLNITLWTPGKQIWIMPVNQDDASSKAVPVTAAPYHTHYDFAWNSNSDQLAYVRFEQTTLTQPPEIWVLNSLTFQEKSLIIGGFSPKWIP